MDLPLISALFMLFALTMYVMLDGFDLGVGALLLAQRDEQVRDRMVDAIAPTWDGNETWLIMAGVTLLAGFPLAYGILIPALYVPVVIMLLSLGLRGVSFEFRHNSRTSRRRWDVVFAAGSVVAGLAQGVMVGGLIQGVNVDRNAFAARRGLASSQGRRCDARLRPDTSAVGSSRVPWPDDRQCFDRGDPATEPDCLMAGPSSGAVVLLFCIHCLRARDRGACRPR